ncbi:hypothetical protein Ddc_00304 [Ditylenchus destructor]|nr:hypothetical protein Ddc_00304 [Ditylenchus destructor]
MTVSPQSMRMGTSEDSGASTNTELQSEENLLPGAYTPQKTYMLRKDTHGYAADQDPNPGFSGFPEAINPGRIDLCRRNRYQSTPLIERKRLVYHTPGSRGSDWYRSEHRLENSARL